MDVGRVRDLATAQENRLVDFAQRLIRTPSLPGEEGDAALLRQAGLALAGDVYVAGAVQEEVGGLGSLELARTTRTDRAVIGEASKNELRRGHRGRIELIVRIEGRACHASAPERGINPYYSLASFLSALRDVDTLEDPFLGAETFAPTLLFTDQASANVVPGEVRLHIDWRTVPLRGPEDIRSEVARRLEGALVDGAAGQVTIKELRLRAYTGVERELPAARASASGRATSASRTPIRSTSQWLICRWPPSATPYWPPHSPLKPDTSRRGGGVMTMTDDLVDQVRADVIGWRRHFHQN